VNDLLWIVLALEYVRNYAVILVVVFRVRREVR
jgi:hypothetical protein